MRKHMIGGIVGVAALGAAATALAAGGGAGTSRLDDGKDLLSQSKITEQQAIAAAQSAKSGKLDEVDLEHAGGKLVWNVDVGSYDVKVDAADGHVVSSNQDD